MALIDRKKFKRYWMFVGELILKKNVFFNASAITFNLFICAIPFTLILISILGYILSADAAFDELMRYGRELFPAFTYESETGDLIEGTVTLEFFIEPLVGSRQLFGILGLIILIVFAQGLFHTLKQVLFDIFEFQDRKSPTMEFVYNFFAFGIVGGVFIFFTMAVSLISFFSFDTITIPYTEIAFEIAWISDLLTGFLPILFMFFLFYSIFRFISERRMNAKVSFIAAIFYIVLFELAKIGVSFYLQHAFETYQTFYQGYAVLTVISFWAFYTAVLFVFTTILAKAYQEIYLEPVSAIKEDLYTAIS